MTREVPSKALRSVVLTLVAASLGPMPMARGAGPPAASVRRVAASAKPTATGEPTEATGEETDEAASKAAALAAFEAARARYLAGDFVGAAAEFRRSYAIRPSLEALVAAARAYAQAGAILEALEAYEEYVEFEDDDAARSAEARRHLRVLRGEVGELALEVEAPEGIEALRLNGEVVTLGDFPRRILPGKIILWVREAGFPEPRTIESEIRGGGRTVIELRRLDKPGMPQGTGPEGAGSSAQKEPKGPKKPSEGAESGASQPRGARGLKVSFWSGVGLTAGFAVTTATLGALTLRQRERYADALCGGAGGGPCGEGASYPFAEESRFYSLRRATNVTLGIGVAIAVTTLALGLGLRLRGRARADAGLRVGLGPGGMILRY